MRRLLPLFLFVSACASSSNSRDANARRAAAEAAAEGPVNDSAPATQDALAAASPASGVVLTEQNGVISAQLMSCAVGQLLQSTGTGWQCAAPPQLPTFAAGLAQNGNVVSVEGLAQVVNVAKAGGDFTGIQAAIDSISDADSRTRYIVRVAPGRYGENVVMKEFVDIEGAGEGSTIVAGSVEGAPAVTLSKLSVESPSTAVHTASAMTLRRVAIDASSTKGEAIALSTTAGAKLSASHVSISASGTNPKALVASGGEISMADVDISVTGARGPLTAISVVNAKVSLDHVSLKLSTGNECVGIVSDSSTAQTLDLAYVTLAVSNCSVSAIGVKTTASISTDMRHSRVSVSGGSLATSGLELYGPAVLFASQIRVSSGAGSPTVHGVETGAAARLSDLDIEVSTNSATPAELNAVFVFTGKTTIDRCRLTVPKATLNVRGVKATARGSAFMANTGMPDGVGVEGTSVKCVYPYLTDSYTVTGAAQATLFGLQACPIGLDQIP